MPRVVAACGVALAFALSGAARTVGAEEMLVRGMGRQIGWLVATDSGQIRFRDCGGRLTPVADGRLERTTRRCPAAPEGVVEVAGVVRAIDPAAGVLLVEDGGGRTHGFYVAAGAGGRVLPDGLGVGRPVRVTGTVPGRAGSIAPR
ncbi:MAG TPA: hypothetical protein VFG47_21545 [Geminicoccaceae bacterium]|nr:hypothetical protein [Geminicoccaceae bacterium]